MELREIYEDILMINAQKLIEAVYTIAEKNALLGKSRKENEKVLSGDLLDIWDIYLRGFETNLNHPMDLIMEISEKQDCINEIKDLREKLENGEELSDEENSYYADYKDTSLTEEEEKLYSAYVAAVHKEAEERLHAGKHSYPIIIRAQRLYKLITLEAPDCVKEPEEDVIREEIAAWHNEQQ